VYASVVSTVGSNGTEIAMEDGKITIPKCALEKPVESSITLEYTMKPLEVY